MCVFLFMPGFLKMSTNKNWVFFNEKYLKMEEGHMSCGPKNSNYNEPNMGEGFKAQVCMGNTADFTSL